MANVHFLVVSGCRPATSPRLVEGLLYLQHAFKLSNEAVVARWVENPYYQHFCGETFFQHRAPIDPSSLTRWRNRFGEEGVEWLLTKTIGVGRASGAVADKNLKRVSVDTTVMEKTIAHPSDARLVEKARQKAGGPRGRGRDRTAPEVSHWSPCVRELSIAAPSVQARSATANARLAPRLARAVSRNPYDGHTLNEALEQIEILTDRRPSLALVDRSYRGHASSDQRHP